MDVRTRGLLDLYIPRIKKVNFKSFPYINFFRLVCLYLGRSAVKLSFFGVELQIFIKNELTHVRNVEYIAHALRHYLLPIIGGLDFKKMEENRSFAELIFQTTKPTKFDS